MNDHDVMGELCPLQNKIRKPSTALRKGFDNSSYVFPYCSQTAPRLLRDWFDTPSTIVRQSFDNCSTSLRQRFDCSSTGLRQIFAFSRTTVEQQWEKSRRWVEAGNTKVASKCLKHPKSFASLLQQGFNLLRVKLTVFPSTIAHTRKSLVKNSPLALKLSALCFSLITVLFCVCTVQARQQEGGAPAANGLASKQGYVLTGRVLSASNGMALDGATVRIKDKGNGVLTDRGGVFEIRPTDTTGTLIVSYIGYKVQEIKFSRREAANLIVRLEPLDNLLDEALVVAYGTTTRRLNTGSVGRVSAEEIASQPVSNPLATLQGKIPGLEITQTSGVPGSAFNVQIRGRSSLDPARSTNTPLFIIDGVPLLMGNEVSNQLSSAANNPTQISQGGLSPLNMINPSDIQSIEVLKDADATAIYGSRGANGVILITTKKGNVEKLKVDFRAYTGIGHVTRTMDFLNTAQYLAMREEAFRNDGLEPTVNTAPDLLLWERDRYTDWKKKLIGGKASVTDMQLSVSGGSATTHFAIGAGYRQDGTVFPGNQGNKRTSVNVSISHVTPDKRFEVGFSGNYSDNRSNLTVRDLTLYTNLPPNFPDPFDEEGKLKFRDQGISYVSLGLENPYAYSQRMYEGNSANLITNAHLSYKLWPSVTLRTDLGYNSTVSQETSITPSSSLDPQSSATPSANFAVGNGKSWIVEPQLEWKKELGSNTLVILVGATWQSLDSKSQAVNATGFADDLLLGSLSAASSLNGSSAVSTYHYNAFFGRVNYNWKERYIVNITGRRDGSSRFGPDNRFANFGAMGLAWIFSEEPWVKRHLSFLSFGKIRSSYGVTGNDQIGNYLYLDTWASTSRPYDGVAGLRPTRLFNPDYHWEKNRKLEVATELGVWDDKVLFTAAYYNNRSSNQLVAYTLPATAGFASVNQNIDALVSNTGTELSASARPFIGPTLRWTSSFNITFPHNRLKKFPNLASSSYASRYVIGEPLTVIQAYEFQGVDPSTGIYQYTDRNGDGALNTDDYVIVGNTDPKFYGGFSNTLGFHKWELQVLLEFRKQLGVNYYVNTYSYPPGFIFNQPLIVEGRWKQPGDDFPIQKLTSRAGNPAYSANTRLGSSSAIYSDASFLRMKNVSLSYTFDHGVRRLNIANLKIYAQAQNLLTWTNYVGADPENQNMFMLPPLRMVTLGLQATF